jgi:hypothetical protein
MQVPNGACTRLQFGGEEGNRNFDFALGGQPFESIVRPDR